MLAATLGRVAPLGPSMVLCSDDQRFLVAQECQQACVSARIVLEPVARGTALSVAVAAVMAAPGTTLLICPADRHIPDTAAFREAVECAFQFHQSGSQKCNRAKPPSSSPD